MLCRSLQIFSQHFAVSLNQKNAVSLYSGRKTDKSDEPVILPFALEDGSLLQGFVKRDYKPASFGP